MIDPKSLCCGSWFYVLCSIWVIITVIRLYGYKTNLSPYRKFSLPPINASDLQELLRFACPVSGGLIAAVAVLLQN